MRTSVVVLIVQARSTFLDTILSGTYESPVILKPHRQNAREPTLGRAHNVWQTTSD